MGIFPIICPGTDQRLTRVWAALRRARHGNVAVIVALAIPAAATLVLGATDVAFILGDRERMRSIAEASALAGARNLSVAMSEADATAHARAMADAMIAEWGGAPDLVVSATIVEATQSAKGVRVSLDARRPSFFGDLLPPGGWRYGDAATASSVGSKPLCVLAFSGAKNKDFLLQDSAEIRAPDCLVHSNGDVEVKGGRIEAGQTQAVRDATGDISPDPVTDAPVVKDPFSDLDQGATGLQCVSKSKHINIGVLVRDTLTVPSGVHCGVIDVSGDATVVLAPGEHRFALGSLTMRDRARLIGDDVVLIFDKTWNTKFKDDSVISLGGRRSGAYAGFVMMADRGNTQRFEIDSTHVDRLDGVIYIPKAELLVSGRSDVARQSDWTVIVANRLIMAGNPHLYLNADYSGSEIDVPVGVGPRGGGARLID